MKIKLSCLLFLIAFNVSAFAGQDRGGGDLCEGRIKIIRNDLKEWINKGGSDGLVLSSDISLKKYKRTMLNEIEKAKIKCVSEKDPGHPVEIDGVPKVCRFDKDSNKSTIKCDLDKFSKLSESDQYVLIHHEYAGLAKVEIPTGDDSNYDISNQISAYLEDTVVKKLVVKKVETKRPIFFPGKYGNTNQYCGMQIFSSPMGDKIIIKYIHNPGLQYVHCTVNGRAETWVYNNVYNAYQIKHANTTCLLSNAEQYGIQMTCYYYKNTELQSIDTYHPY